MIIMEDNILDLKEKCKLLNDANNKLAKEITQLKEIIKDNTTLIKDNCGNYEELSIDPLKLVQYKEENKKLKSIIKTLIAEYNLEPTEYVKKLLESSDK